MTITHTTPDPLADAQVGDGATWRIWTDQHAGTIIKRTASAIWWQRDKATILNGPSSGEPDALRVSPGGFCAHVSGSQRYRYEPDPDAPVLKFTRRAVYSAGGRLCRKAEADAVRYVWKRPGDRTRSPGGTLRAGRCEHYDYNF